MFPGLRVGQYEEAANLSQKVKIATNETGKGLIFTGHSLGGGLAQLGALMTNSIAVTFNTVGLSNGTLSSRGLPDRDNIDDSRLLAYEVKGEALSRFQDETSISRSALGRRVSLNLDWGGEMSASAKHKISAVLGAILCEYKRAKTLNYDRKLGFR